MPKRRPRRVALYLPKGGIGKTTISAHLAVGLARAGKRVLLVDADPRQAQIVIYFANAERRPGVHQVVVQGTDLGELVQFPVDDLGTLALLTGTPNSTTDLIKHLEQDKYSMNWYKQIAKALQPYEDSFDYILFDLGPMTTKLSKAILWYCSELWVPWKVDYMSMDSEENILPGELDELERDWSFVRYIIPNDVTQGKARVVPKNEEARKKFRWPWMTKEENREVVDWFSKVKLNEAMEILDFLFQKFGKHKVTPPIRSAAAAFLECQKQGKTVFDLYPDGDITLDLMRLVHYIICDEEAALSEQQF